MLDQKRTEKLLTYVLRHHPEELELTMDERGWVRVHQLLKNGGWTFDELDHIVQGSDKKRFEFDITGEYIRACQGHSINVDLNLVTHEPPVLLYHGTSEQNVESIVDMGINAGSRTHVHLSTSPETAKAVGSRKGRSIVITVQARRMHLDGYSFYCSTNGVWLTQYVPPIYLGTP